MCRPATCPDCGKASYSGCGRHVDQVLANVPKDQICVCVPVSNGGSLLSRLRGR